MSSELLYLAIGHICQDMIPGGWKVGGTVSFALRVAAVLGCETRLITSVTADFPLAQALPQPITQLIPAPQHTVFENVQTARGRVQDLTSIKLTVAHDPGGLQRAGGRLEPPVRRKRHSMRFAVLGGGRGWCGHGGCSRVGCWAGADWIIRKFNPPLK